MKPYKQESKFNRSMDLPDQLLEGTIDVHIHVGPHLKSSPRRLDPFQAAEMARDAGMRALVLMDVFENSSGTAWLVNRKVEGIQVFGGIIINTVYGGLNPRAVKTAYEYGDGAKFVSFGAHSTWFIAKQEGNIHENQVKPFIEYDQEFIEEEFSRAVRIPMEDPLPKELDNILKIIADHPESYLNTGHVSGDEAVRLIDLAERYGIKKVLVAACARNDMTLEQRKYAAKKGAYLEAVVADYVYPSGAPKFNYYVEEKYLNLRPMEPPKVQGGLRGFREELEAVGAEHYILGTDYGIRAIAPPLEGMRQFIASLLDFQVPVEDIRRMTADNPAKLLGLD